MEKRCKAEGLSLRAAAIKTGLSHATIQGVINGSAASAETIKKLASGFGGDGHQRIALEDKLLILAGYKTRPGKDEPNELVALLLDKLSGFTDPQLRAVRHFVDFISEIGGK